MTLKGSRPEWLISIGQGAAWLVTSFGTIVTALFIREAVVDVLRWNQSRVLQTAREQGEVGKALETSTQITATDFIVIFILACLAVWAVIEIDNYFRKGRPKGLLLKRVLTVAGIEIGIIIGSVLLRMLLPA